MPPLRSTRNVVIAFKSRAGRAPPLLVGEFWRLQSPRIFLSSVTCGDSFPQGKAFGAGCPIDWRWRKAARRGYCARRRVSERNRRTAAALSAEIDPSLHYSFPQRGKPPVRSSVMSRGCAVHQEGCFFSQVFCRKPYTNGGMCVIIITNSLFYERERFV